jgi:hypothetical protein
MPSAGMLALITVAAILTRLGYAKTFLILSGISRNCYGSNAERDQTGDGAGDECMLIFHG